ncbi:hypothetical protein BJ508DRAFT_326379 [Ascobolus immersus RN42]|uniref:Derlin n=1 Tax=Ascobolus immersus RN42 TaxID=1160509 RepID=A0A3N4IIK3_ASCIM|nr:hypothetical protein BJ508DRAFT_326379 [Ascobolus immersus RN42]
MPNVFLDYYFQIPPISRTITLTTTVLYCLSSLNIVPPYKLIYVRALLIPQVWRFITPFFTIVGQPINFAWDTFTLHRLSTSLEALFPTPATYATFLATSIITVNILNLYLTSFLLFPSLLGALSYYYSTHLPADTKVGILFFQIPVRFYPYALMAMDFLMTQDTAGVKAMGMGVLGGHMFVYLDEVLPAVGGRKWISAPAWLERLLGTGRASGGVSTESAGTGRRPGSSGAGASTGSSTGSSFFGSSGTWGKRSGGRRLGD